MQKQSLFLWLDRREEEEAEEGDYFEQPDDENNKANVEGTTTVAPGIRLAAAPVFIVSEAVIENRIVNRIMALMNNTLEILNNKIDVNVAQLKSQIEGLSQRASSPGSGRGRSSSPANSNAVQGNTKMILQLQGLVLSLQNKTENSQSYNETAKAILDHSEQFKSELNEMGYQLDTLRNDLKNQNLQGIQRAFDRLAKLDQFVEAYEQEKKEVTRKKLVKNILDAFENDRNEEVKALLDDLTRENLLNSSISEIVGGMFDQNIRNYKKTITLFQSAKREQFKLGLASLIDIFHKTSAASNPVEGNSNRNSSSRSLLGEPEYLELAYLAKTQFGMEFRAKFPAMVQNLVFGAKVCIINLLSNFFLSMDKEGGLKDGGYLASTRRKAGKFTTAVLCDWEMFPANDGTSFVIRRKNDGEALNLNVLGGTVYVGSDDYNPSYSWKIQLRKDATVCFF